MERIFLPLKLKCLLPSDVYKVADILFACQKEGCITYSSANLKSFHMPKEAVELAIQTLIERDIISYAIKEDKFFRFEINKKELERYEKSNWININESSVLAKATAVRFTSHYVEEKKEEPKKEAGMSVDELRALMAKLQEQLKQQETNSSSDGLPW
jgi:hypothetical protein